MKVANKGVFGDGNEKLIAGFLVGQGNIVINPASTTQVAALRAAKVGTEIIQPISPGIAEISPSNSQNVEVFGALGQILTFPGHSSDFLADSIYVLQERGNPTETDIVYIAYFSESTLISADTTPSITVRARLALTNFVY